MLILLSINENNAFLSSSMNKRTQVREERKIVRRSDSENLVEIFNDYFKNKL